MIEVTTYLRVRYGETDQMGYMYYGNYAQYYEVGRVELFRHIGLSYKEIESSGVMLPVLKLESNFLFPAYYDERLKIVTKIPEIPAGARILFEYEIYNESARLINKGRTELVFVDTQKKRPIKIPERLKRKLEELTNLD